MHAIREWWLNNWDRYLITLLVFCTALALISLAAAIARPVAP